MVTVLRVALSVLAITSCGLIPQDEDDSVNETMANRSGLQLFTEPHTDGNAFACSSCHALEEPAQDGIRRAGHQVGDAFKRPTFKNGQLTSLLDAVNSCRTEWMNATPFATTQPAWTSLSSYLEEAAVSRDANTLTFEIVSPPTGLTGGDADEGMRIFNSSCSICHGTNAVGTTRAPAISGTSLSRQAIAGRIRTSGSTQSDVYDGLTGGKMPFFASDRLSDSELIHILAYLENTEAANVEPVMSSVRVDISLANVTTECGSDHALVGKSLTFSTKFHQVAGTATVVDNCTIHLDSFTFDGQGIDIRVYTGSNGSFRAGQSISKDLLGMPFNQGSAILHLPLSVSLDDFDSLSIWCVPIGISFGDGVFQ